MNVALFEMRKRCSRFKAKKHVFIIALFLKSNHNVIIVQFLLYVTMQCCGFLCLRKKTKNIMEPIFLHLGASLLILNQAVSNIDCYVELPRNLGDLLLDF